MDDELLILDAGEAREVVGKTLMLYQGENGLSTIAVNTLTRLLMEALGKINIDVDAHEEP